MCMYYCDINLLHISFVSAHFQLAVMKPENGLGEYFMMQQYQLLVNFCLSHNIKYNFRQFMTLYTRYQRACWIFPNDIILLRIYTG